MLTRCPECETTFRLGAQDLRRAGGKVRCGECESVFNALAYLEEEAEQLSPAYNMSQAEPSDDKQSVPGDDYASAAEDTLYDDNYDGQLEDEHDPENNYTSAEAVSDADIDNESVDDGGILVTDQDDNESSTVFEFDSAAEEPTFADEPGSDPDLSFDTEQERWPTYSEPVNDDLVDDDDDDVVSFVTTGDNSIDYPEVNDAVSAAIGASLVTDDGDQDHDIADDGDNPSDEPVSAFDDELDISGADRTVEFSISDDDDDDAAAEIITLSDDDDVDATTTSDDQASTQYGDAANDDDEFDDTIWERIPGVGSGDPASDDSLFARPGFRQPASNADAYGQLGHDEPPQEAGISDDATDAASPDNEDTDLDRDEAESKTDVGMDTLEFDAPADTWSNIFSRASQTGNAPGSAGDTQPVPVITDEKVAPEEEELSAWSRELNESAEPVPQGINENSDEDEVAVSDERADWVSEIDANDTGEESADDNVQTEWVIEVDDDAPLVAATEKDDWVTEQNRANASAETGQDDSAAEYYDDASLAAEAATEDTDSPSDTRDDLSGPDDARIIFEEAEEDAASLTAAFSTGEYNEEEYDVQHIILSDESEPDSAGLTQAFASGTEEAPPPWQPEGQENAPAKTSRAPLWLVAGILVVATLVLQLIHYNRDSLAGNDSWGESVRSIYSGLGMELFPNWSLDDYEIRGSEAIAGESGPDIMDIRAQIAAVGRKPTGLPHIRIVLRDRWSNPVAAKTLGPDEYADIESLPASALLNPNETLAAHVSIVDPGSGAQGFELELCLPRRHTGLECTGRPFE